MSISIRLDASALVNDLDAVVKNLPKALGKVSKKTAKYGKSQMAKIVYDELNVIQREIKKDISVRFLTPTSAVLLMRRGNRFSLKRFKPKQYGAKTRGKNKGAGGVQYKINRGKGAAKTRLAGAFIVPSLGDHVYKRISKSRLPIAKLHGPSPWGV